MKADSDRIIEIFNQASAIAAPEERARFLDEACRDDPEGRAEIESLLQAEEPARDFLKPPPPPEVPLTEKPGDRIGRYQLLEKIGEGGGGIVYMAEQEEPVRRRVALKIIKLGMETREVVARFEAERQALAMMDHPSIAKVFDGGATASGRPYFVMELVRGTPITHYCDEHRLTTRQRLELFVQVCQAVQHAHQKGVIHRDLKPSNVLVTELDGRSTPKVIDFGVAKATEQRLTEKTLFTRFGQLVGTPAYMSPEQAGFGGLDIDTRSDVYSLGVLLYELLTGRPPFDSKKLVEAGYEAILKTIREVEPPKPSTKLSTLSQEELVATASQRNAEAGKLNSLVRGELDWIAMKALEKDRARRYETATSFANDIERHLNNEPIVARPPSKLYEFQKTVRRHKVGFAATTAVILALTFGLGFSIWTAVKERRARERAEAAEQAATTMNQILRDVLDGIDPAVARGRDTTVLKEIVDRIADRVDRGITNQPGVEVDLCMTLGKVYTALGQNDQAAAALQRGLAVERMNWGNDAPNVGFCYVLLARVLSRQWKLDEAEAAYNEAIRSYILREATNSLEMSALQIDMADVLAYRSKWSEAEALLKQGIALRRKLLGTNDSGVASGLYSLGIVLQNQGKLDEAENNMQQALDIDQKLLPPIHPLLARDLHGLAALLQGQGKLAKAEQFYLEALEMQKNLFNGEHEDISLTLHNLATLLRDDHRLDVAETYEKEAIAMRRKVAPDLHPFLARYYGSLSSILLEQGKLNEAELAAREGVAVCTNLFAKNPDHHGDMANALLTLARVLRKQEKLPEAEETAQQAAEIYRRKFPNDIKTFTAHVTFGEILSARKFHSRAESALKFAWEGFEARKQVLKESQKVWAKGALKGLAQVCDETNRPDEAKGWRLKLTEFESAK